MTPDPNTDTSLLITVQLGSLKDRGHFSSLLTVVFPNERTLTLAVTAEVVAPVTAHPQTLSYRVAVSGTQPALEVILSAEVPFEVLKVETPTALDVRVMPNTGEQHQKRLKVVWHVPNSPEPLRAEIQILTTADSLPIRIPVYGFIQKD